MSLRDAQTEIRKHFIDRYHGYGHIVVVDLARNWPVWERLCGNRVRYVGYTGDDPSGAVEGILESEPRVDVVDIGDHDPWGLYADVLSHFVGDALSVFLSVSQSSLRLEEGLARYVWERVDIPIDWSMWKGAQWIDALVLRAGLSYACDRGFIVEDAQRFRFVGKPFPWRYNYLGLRLRSAAMGGNGEREGDGAAGVQGQGGAAGGEPPPPRP
jgi:hypothetical protein